MGQKIHPLGFRLGVTQEHTAHWFVPKREYAGLLYQDILIRDYLNKKFSELGIISVQIHRQKKRLILHLSVTRLDILLRQPKDTLKIARAELKKLLTENNSRLQTELHQEDGYIDQAIKFQIQAVENPDVHAQVLASHVVQQLETRVPFRRAVREVIRKAEFAGVRGIKIQISGRLNGAEIARSEWVRKGRVPLHTLRAKIDYALCTAKTIYGILGVKVWVYQP
uniref:Small ribosomal subunit protein uS3c n=1 Tax=Prasinoderma coloniale TaxID=156133 RepID=A0A088CJ40_9VIRI|nr:ribosomal protein S3 [Prasinoderma coloniale]AID67566.1 ribosomal protein S3 [Prasinoderma coloniale]